MSLLCCVCLQLDLDWAVQIKDGVPQLNRQSLIPGGSVELTHENLFGDSQSLSVSLSSSDWRNPSADLGFQMSYTEPFYAKNTTRNVQVGPQLSFESAVSAYQVVSWYRVSPKKAVWCVGSVLLGKFVGVVVYVASDALALLIVRACDRLVHAYLQHRFQIPA